MTNTTNDLMEKLTITYPYCYNDVESLRDGGKLNQTRLADWKENANTVLAECGRIIVDSS